MPIKNRGTLLSELSGDERRCRALLLDALDAALTSADPHDLIRRHVKPFNGEMLVDGQHYHLNRFRRIYVIGGGKASGAMAEALSRLLGERIDGGVVNVTHGTASHFQTGRIKLNEARHPVPDELGVMGVKKMLRLLGDVEKRDLVICLISGGGSALLPMPVDGVSLEDIRSLTQSLLRSGAPIREINAVRKHLSAVKGGRLARRLYPATVLGLTISDVVGDDVETIASGPISPDRTTYQDAIRTLEKHRLWQGSPEPVRRVLSEGAAGRIEETPKPGDPVFKRIRNVVIGSGRVACEAAVESLRRAGLNTVLLTTHLEGEARDVGALLSTIALEIDASDRPLKRPAAIVAGGETTVTVRGDGLGGRNQEVALGFALKIEGMKNVAFASIDTDGLDGSTDAAGAVVDGSTVGRAHEKGLHASGFLERNDTYSFFLEVGGLVVTGATFTNVNDLAVLVLA